MSAALVPAEGTAESLCNPAWDKKRIEAAANFLDGESYIVHKVTRAGFSTSFALAASSSGKNVLMLYPTNRILDDTLRQAVDIVGIRGNAACRYKQEEIERDPLFGQLPMSLPGKCPDCKYAEDCWVLDIDRNPGATLIGMTLAKLAAVMFSSSERSEFIKQVSADIQVVMIDESHTITGSTPMLPVDTHFLDLVAKLDDEYPRPADVIRIPRARRKLGDKYPRLVDVIERWSALRRTAEVPDLWCEVDAMPKNWLVRELDVPHPFDLQEMLNIHGELRKLARNRKELNVSNQEVLDLAHAVDILSNKKARLTYIKTDGHPRIYIAGQLNRNELALKMFFHEVAPRASVLFVSGTQFEPKPGLFISISGKQLAEVEYPDFTRSNSKMSIYCDTWRFGTKMLERGYTATMDKIMEKIDDVLLREKGQGVVIFALNRRLAKAIEKRLGRPDITVSWYRSAQAIGIKSDCRVLIAVGAADKPFNAEDASTNGFEESQALRKNEVDASTWQAWSRAKDPDGQVESRVYCIGVTPDRGRDIATWGIGRRVEVDDSPRVLCDHPFESPTIKTVFVEHKKDPIRQKGHPNLSRVWSSSLDFCEESLSSGAAIEIDTQNAAKSRIYNIYGKTRENGYTFYSGRRCYAILYQNPLTATQLELTTRALSQLYVNRSDYHVEQAHFKDAAGRYPYRKVNTTDFKALVAGMFEGSVTPAMYSLDEDGNTSECTFDVDCHNESDEPAEPKVVALVKVIEEAGCQAIVVASGSPHSFHVKVPILRTTAAVSRDFAKSIARKAGVKCEIFPKQSGKTRYGNALKMPCAVNRKTGVRSQLLDSNTLEPVDAVAITRIAELRDVKAEIEEVGGRKYLSSSYRPKPNNKKGMRQCLVDAQCKDLVGAEGHTTRVAIAAEAIAEGYSEESIVDMFRNQKDFSEAYTLRQVRGLKEGGYNPFRCSTLQERCGNFIDCHRCGAKKEIKVEI